MSIAQWTLLTEQWSIHVYLFMISLFLEEGLIAIRHLFFLDYCHGKNGEKNSAIFAIFANNFSPLLTFSPSIFSPFFYCGENGKKDEMIFAFCHFCHRFFAILAINFLTIFAIMAKMVKMAKKSFTVHFRVTLHAQIVVSYRHPTVQSEASNHANRPITGLD